MNPGFKLHSIGVRICRRTQKLCNNWPLQTLSWNLFRSQFLDLVWKYIVSNAVWNNLWMVSSFYRLVQWEQNSNGHLSCCKDSERYQRHSVCYSFMSLSHHSRIEKLKPNHKKNKSPAFDRSILNQYRSCVFRLITEAGV